MSSPTPTPGPYNCWACRLYDSYEGCVGAGFKTCGGPEKVNAQIDKEIAEREARDQMRPRDPPRRLHSRSEGRR